MGPSETATLRLHEDAARFLEAINATAATTGFAPRLIEKDYFCTVLLQYLAPVDGALVFKGGTCLAKVHAGFHRLSEDLDFVIPTPVSASRAERSRRARILKGLLAEFDGKLPGVRLSRALEGANNSAQYTAVLRYRSPLRDVEDTIAFEVGLREPLLTPAVQGEAKTLLLDPVSGSGLVPAFYVPCLSREETMAEKLRAALCRREVAIRDFYDIDHAVHRLGMRLDDPQSVGLVRQKLAVPGNEPPDVSLARLDALRVQVDTELMPVLRAADFAAFDLDRAFATVTGIAARVQ
jgi:predicted nucleotidyltransferase component of viral defense system